MAYQKVLKKKHLYEPSPRAYSFSAPLDGQLWMWGGDVDSFHKKNPELTATVKTFDPLLETWSQRSTKGSPPCWVINGACTSSGQCMYMYGGHDRVTQEGSLHQLDIHSFTWRLLSSYSSAQGPRMKSASRMLCYDNSLVLFGGYGDHSGCVQSRKGNKLEWTNELHVYDLEKGNRAS